MERDRQNFFVILGHFLSFYPSNNPKNQNFEKMKKTPGVINVLHMCTKNYDRMMYYSLDMVYDGRTDGRTDERTEKVTYSGCRT